MPTLADAEMLDRDDPLAALRDEFFFSAADTATIYANGNSLGRLPITVRAALGRAVEEEWGTGLVRSWADWLDLSVTVGDLVGTTMLGAAPGETIVADSTTVNFYKLATAALGAAGSRRVVITDAGNFPTDRFVLQGLPAVCDVVSADPSPDALAEALTRHTGDVALVALSHVAYSSGARLDLPAITRLVHDHGALVLWDVSHSAGATLIDLSAHGVDLAVGCTYKYLNAGPGAPGFLYVRNELHERLAQPIPGWFGSADQFGMRDRYEPAPGIRRFLSGTTDVLGSRAVEAAVAVLASAGVGPLAAKGGALTGFLIECIDEVLDGAEFTIVTPRDPAARGAHVAVRHADAWRICRALIQHMAVIADFREPDVIRIGLAPAYSRYVDAYEVAGRIREVVDRGLHRDMPEARTPVT